VKVFLSHSTSDRELVEDILGAVQPFAEVYCTEFDGKAGENVHEKIQQKIRESDLLVVLLTSVAIDSNYVHQEVGFAKGAGRLVVPIVATGIASDKLGMLQGIEYISLDSSASAEAVSRLGKRIDDLRQKSLKAEAEATQDAMQLLGVVLAIAGIVFWTRGAK
jgi:hypothetical protein